MRRKERTNRVGTRTKRKKNKSTSEYHARTKRLVETKARNAFRLPTSLDLVLSPLVLILWPEAENMVNK